MPRNLKLYVAGIVAAGAFALLAATFVFPIGRDYPIAAPFDELGDLAPLAGLAFWTAVTLLASAMPISMPRGAKFAVSVSTIMGATILGGPTAGGCVALLGTTELREVRGQIPWYGTLANHAGSVLPAVAAGVVMWPFGTPGDLTVNPTQGLATPTAFVAMLLGGCAFLAINAGMTAIVVAWRTG